LTESHKFLLPQRSPKKVSHAKGIPQITCIHTGAHGIAMADILEIVFTPHISNNMGVASEYPT